ncbi:MAG: hypothetical protein GY856_07100 [bacterium]|nr:hypothetical protein [bacterium]
MWTRILPALTSWALTLWVAAAWVAAAPLGAQYIPPGSTTPGTEIPNQENLNDQVEEARWRLGAIRLSPWLGVRDASFVVTTDEQNEQQDDFTASVGAGLRAYRLAVPYNPRARDLTSLDPRSPSRRGWRYEDTNTG